MASLGRAWESQISLLARSSNSNPKEEDGDDESKTRKHTSFVARTSAHVRHGSGSHCLAVSFSLFLLLLVASFLFSRSCPVICVPAYNSVACTTQANHEGLASDFGSWQNRRVDNKGSTKRACDSYPPTISSESENSSGCMKRRNFQADQEENPHNLFGGQARRSGASGEMGIMDSPWRVSEEDPEAYFGRHF